MSWSSGNALLYDVVTILHDRLKDKITEKLFDKIIVEIVDAFEDMDCDTGDMYHDAHPILKRALDKIHPEWADEENDE